MAILDPWMQPPFGCELLSKEHRTWQPEGWHRFPCKQTIGGAPEWVPQSFVTSRVAKWDLGYAHTSLQACDAVTTQLPAPWIAQGTRLPQDTFPFPAHTSQSLLSS